MFDTNTQSNRLICNGQSQNGINDWRKKSTTNRPNETEKTEEEKETESLTMSMHFFPHKNKHTFFHFKWFSKTWNFSLLLFYSPVFCFSHFSTFSIWKLFFFLFFQLSFRSSEKYFPAKLCEQNWEMKKKLHLSKPRSFVQVSRSHFCCVTLQTQSAKKRIGRREKAKSRRYENCLKLWIQVKQIHFGERFDKTWTKRYGSFLSLIFLFFCRNLNNRNKTESSYEFGQNGAEQREQEKLQW